MRNKILLAVSFCLAAGTVVFADAWDKKTKVTFSAPVQIPGTDAKSGVITLTPGTYVFRLMESSATRHIVQVTNERQNKVYSTILAIPDYRLNPTSKTVMYFSERKGGAPPAIKSWFYPGDNFGHRFVYPKVQAVQVAATVNQPVPSHTVEVVTVEKVVQVPVYIQTPAKQEVAYDAKTFDKLDAADTAGEDGEAVKTPAPAAAEPAKPLPKTASPVYSLGLAGLMLLGVSMLVRRAAAQLR